MAKKKTVRKSGVLAVDEDNSGFVCFFAGRKRDGVGLGSMGLWYKRKLLSLDRGDGPTRLWTRKGFEQRYDFLDENGKPCSLPRRGTAVELEYIEL